MKALKYALISLGVVLALAAVLAGVALIPAVQTWAVRRVLAGRPGLKLSVSRVAVGPSAADIGAVRCETGGIVVTAKSVHLAYSAWDYLRHRRIEVADLELHGIQIDARHPSAGAASPSAAPGAAPLGAWAAPVRLPLDAELGRLSVDGNVLLPSGRSAAFVVTGGGVGAGRSGRLDWRADFADTAPAAPLRAAHAQGAIAVSFTSDRLLDAASLDAEIAAKGARLPSDLVKIRLAAAQPSADADKTLTATVSLIHGGRAEPLFQARSVSAAGTDAITGTWTVSVRPAQATAFLSAFGLPRASLAGTGRFSLNPRTGEGDASGGITAGLAHLETLSPALAGVGAVRFQAEFDGGIAGQVARLERLRVQASDQASRRFLDVEALQKVTLNLANGRVSFPDPRSDLARLSVDSLPLAWLQPALKPIEVGGGELSVQLAVAANPDGSQVRVRAVEPLTIRSLTLRQGTRTLVQGLTFTVTPRIEYAADRVTAQFSDLGVTLPAGDSLSGRLSAAVTGLKGVPQVSFAVDSRAHIVAALRPFLPFDPGPFEMATRAEGGLRARTLTMTQVRASISRTGGDLLMSVQGLQPFSADLASARAAAANPAAAALRVQFGRIPLAWAQSWAAGARISGELTGGAVEIGLPGGSDVTAQVVAPLALRGLGVALNGRTLADALDLDADFAARRQGGKISGELRSLQLRQGTAILVRASGLGSATLGARPTATGSGQLEADLAALAAQPALASVLPLAGGSLNAKFEVATGDRSQIKASVSADGLVARQGHLPLGDLDLRVEAELGSDGRGTLSLPLTLKVGDRTSDMTLAGRFSRTPSLLSFDGKIASNRIHAQDFQALAVLAPAGPASSPPASDPGPAQPAAKDLEPFWHGYAGRISVDLKSVLYGAAYAVTGIQGSFEANARRIGIDSLQGKFKANAFKISGEIAYDGSQARPYALAGLVDVPGFDLGAFLKAADPGEPPAIETKVAIDANLQGNGTNLPDLESNIYGKFKVSGSKGVLRALGKKGGVATAPSTVLGILGAVQGSDTTTAVGQVLGELNPMQFDQFQAEVERGPDLNLKLTQLDFISPDKHLTGTGTISHEAGIPIADQPLRLQLQLAAKDPLAVPLNRLGLLSGNQDSQGYTTMSSPFTITGTLAKPNSSQLWKIVEGAGARAAVSGLGRFLP